MKTYKILNLEIGPEIGMLPIDSVKTIVGRHKEEKDGWRLPSISEFELYKQFRYEMGGIGRVGSFGMWYWVEEYRIGVIFASRGHSIDPVASDTNVACLRLVRNI